MLEETERVSNGVVSFDTQRVVDRLREGGWDEGQARALCDVLREIMQGVATKVDIQELKIATKADIQELKIATKADIKEVKVEMRALEGQMASLRLIMLAGFSFLGILIALGNFL